MQANDPLIGRQFANFRILHLLGRGGMAEVYYGWDVKLQRPVALKVIDARFRDNPAYAQRFVNEARAMAVWHHPNIVQTYYSDDEQGYYYYVMEYIHGLDLEHVLAEYARRKELMPVEDVLRIGRAAAEALDYAHQHNVIHRDVKPSNLLMSADGRCLLTDFGLALNVSQGSLGMVFGSPHYVAPEQARNSSEAVPASDLYSLGVILYEMLTGQVPFDDPSPTSLALHHLMMEPPPPRQINPDLSPEVERILIKALSKRPDQRFPSGAALMQALQTALDTPAPTAPYIPEPADPQASTAQRPPRQLSRLPAVEIVRRNMAPPPVVPPQPADSHVPDPSTSSKPKALSRLSWWGIGCAGLVILGLMFFTAALAINSPNASHSPTSIGIGLLPATTSSIESGLTIVTSTPRPQPTSSATSAPPTPTKTSPPPTSTSVPPTATQVPPTPSPPPKPTAVPAGDRFDLYYDDTSFYIKNNSGKDRSIFPLAFERIDKQDDQGSRFEGWRWGNIYPTFRAGFCLVLEILNDTDHLNPPECRDRYLVIRTPTNDQVYLFWIKNKSSKEFRVLWQDQEVGRCKIAAGSCEVYLP